jgi:hypothetical protein
VTWGRGGAFARRVARWPSQDRHHELGGEAEGWGEIADREAALHVGLGQHDGVAQRLVRGGVAADWARARHVVRRSRRRSGLRLERGRGL